MFLSFDCPTELGPLRQDALLEAGWTLRSVGLKGSGGRLGDGGRLDVGGSGWDHMLSLMQTHGPADLPPVGSLVAGFTWDVSGFCPRAGVLSWGVFPRTFGRSHPCPRPVLLPVGAGFALLHHLLLPPSLPLAPLLSLPRLTLDVVSIHRAVRHTVCPAPLVINPREILLPGDGPWFEILLVLRDAGERYSRGVVVFPGLVAGLLP